MILNIAELEGRFWDGVALAEDYYDVIGGAICVSFIFLGSISILLYKPWRRYIDQKRQSFQEPEDGARAERELCCQNRGPGRGMRRSLRRTRVF